MKPKANAEKVACDRQLKSIAKYLRVKPSKDEMEYIYLCLSLAFLDGRISVWDLQRRKA